MLREAPNTFKLNFAKQCFKAPLSNGCSGAYILSKGGLVKDHTFCGFLRHLLTISDNYDNAIDNSIQFWIFISVVKHFVHMFVSLHRSQAKVKARGSGLAGKTFQSYRSRDGTPQKPKTFLRYQ